MNWTKLRTLIETYFDEEELKTLCFDLRIDYDSLGGNNKSAKVRELIKRCQREKQVEELIHLCRIIRPRTEWPEDEKSIGFLRSSAQIVPRYIRVVIWTVVVLFFLIGLLVTTVLPKQTANVFVPTNTSTPILISINIPTFTPTPTTIPTNIPSLTPTPISTQTPTQLPIFNTSTPEFEQMCGDVDYTIKEYGIPGQISDDGVELHWEWLDFGVSNRIGEQAGYRIDVYVNSKTDGVSVVSQQGSLAVDTLPNTYEIGNSVFDQFEVGTAYVYTIKFFAPGGEDPFCIVEGDFIR